MTELPEKERAAALDTAKRWFSNRNKTRVELAFPYLRGKMDKQELYDYLSNPEDPDIQEMIDKSNETLYESLIETAHSSEITNDVLTQAMLDTHTRLADQSSNQETDVVLSLGMTNSFILRDVISELRTRAVLVKHITGQDPATGYKEAFMASLVGIIRGQGYDLSDSYRLIWKQKPLPKKGSIEAEFKLFDRLVDRGKPEKIQTYIDAGVDPNIAERRVDQEVQQFRNETSPNRDATISRLKHEIDTIQQDFPDPRVIIDKILRTENGKLPL